MVIASAALLIVSVVLLLANAHAASRIIEAAKRAERNLEIYQKGLEKSYDTYQTELRERYVKIANELRITEKNTRDREVRISELAAQARNTTGIALEGMRREMAALYITHPTLAAVRRDVMAIVESRLSEPCEEITRKETAENGTPTIVSQVKLVRCPSSLVVGNGGAAHCAYPSGHRFEHMGSYDGVAYCWNNQS